jgi:DNA (cytosine-5)-methyltransferase 1
VRKALGRRGVACQPLPPLGPPEGSLWLTAMLLEYVSIFSGAGGLDLGLREGAESRCIARVESEPAFCDTIRTAMRLGYLDEAPLYECSVTDLNPADVTRRQSRDSVLGVIGGPPCETYSTMGRRQGLSDPRGLLVFGFARWVEETQPEFFLMENVPAMADAHEGRLFRRFVRKMTAAGYLVTHRILNAADYGSATTRRRLVVVGVPPPHEFLFPAPTHQAPSGSSAAGVAPWTTVGDALGTLPPPSSSPPGYPSGHVLVRHTAGVISRFSTLPQGSYDNVRKRSRLSWTKPSPSLVAGNLKGTRSHIHPIESRELTNRESARIQGFPDGFAFEGSPAAVAKQIANAVPIALGRALAGAIYSHFSRSGLGLEPVAPLSQ